MWFLASSVRWAKRSFGAAARVAVGGHVQLQAHDGLDALVLGGAVELHGAAQRAVVGERHGGHAELVGPPHEVFHTAGAVEQRVLAVHVEMNEWGAHGCLGF